ncbi:diguanylate cyclase (GGDEF)-like protein [Kineococcus xinjiangensis]|uniref:Diguanylate cyclase (GGDEF)-like protein n=1 Tax=Kineococcus xinjiangensis TaxID=512762 RepID=A0A2S6IDS2_9ACTN|nr:diguanylate cyclase [Kineococcus xinjiangensis]PPK92310.1 diguanylate cyclase (GGDEF)-like protein [Kineococcus xinjiangensis]
MGIAVVFTISALVCAGTAVVAWRRRHNTPAAAALAAALLGTALWSGADAFLHLGVDPLVQRIAGRFGFAGIYLTTTALWCLSRAVADPHWRLRRRVALRLAAAPTLLLAALLTNPWHHLMFSSVTFSGSDSVMQLTLGPLFWVHSAYCYALFGWAVQRLVTTRRRAQGVFRHQVTHLLLGACIPLLGNVTAVVLPQGGGPVDYTPVLFTLTGLVNARALLRHGLLKLVPVAREEVVNSIQDAVLVIDSGGTVIDHNPAARALLSRHRPDVVGEVVGRPAAEVVSPALVEPLEDGALHRQVEVLPGLHLDSRISVLHDRHGRPLGRVVVARDISELVEQRRAVQEANARLVEQLALTEALQARLAEEAARDALTGLHNRRHLMEALEEALARAGGEEPVSVVLIDVDHFKSVNDTHGHRGGDAVLRAVATALQRGCRPRDTVARYGGEEFVILLPGTDDAEAVRRAEELRLRCAALAVPVTALPGQSLPGPRSPEDGRRRRDEPGAVITVTFSAGVATSPQHAADADALIAVADHALYAAKAAGRNRVVAAA